MMLKRSFLSTFSFFLLVWGWAAYTAENPKTSLQVQQIDQEIQELEGMKRGFEARALRHEDQAQWLQFNDEAVLEVRRHQEIAQENREKAAEVQKRIDLLKAKRQKLLESSQ